VRLFGKPPSRPVPQSYMPVLESSEVIDLYARLTLHQQAALLRLLSRNVVIDLGEDVRYMGYEFEYNVVGAMISVTPSDEDDA
jgi:hypothetical protein|tara:strand:+ start:61 stop:309 length:249 start_codon:yes stop_codon:yes gene_type:complete